MLVPSASVPKKAWSRTTCYGEWPGDCQGRGYKAFRILTSDSLTNFFPLSSPSPDGHDEPDQQGQRRQTLKANPNRYPSPPPSFTLDGFRFISLSGVACFGPDTSEYIPTWQTAAALTVERSYFPLLIPVPCQTICDFPIPRLRTSCL